MGLISRIKASQAEPVVTQAETETFSRPPSANTTRTIEAVSSPRQSALLDRRDELMRGLAERGRAKRLATDQRLEDVQKISSGTLGSALTSPIKEATSVPRSLQSLREATKRAGPGGALLASALNQEVGIATLPANIAAPEIGSIAEYQAKALSESKTDPKEGLELGAKSIALTGVSAADGHLANVIKAVEIGQEIKGAADVINDKPELTETEEEKISKVLDANKKKVFTAGQLDHIQRHVDNTGYKPSKQLKKQLDTRKKDVIIASVVQDNPQTDFTEGQLINIIKWMKRDPNAEVSGYIGSQIDRLLDPQLFNCDRLKKKDRKKCKEKQQENSLLLI